MKIFIFRRDLRIVDNTSLLSMIKSKHIPIFIFDTQQIENINDSYLKLPTLIVSNPINPKQKLIFHKDFLYYLGYKDVSNKYFIEVKQEIIKHLFEIQPPYVLKLWKDWNNIFPNVNTEKCLKSNGYCAIQLSKRKFCFRHEMS